MFEGGGSLDEWDEESHENFGGRFMNEDKSEKFEDECK